MSVLEALVTDRTAEDAPRARAIRDRYAALGDWTRLTGTESKALSRGYYTRHDLNRVENTVADLARELQGIGYPASISTTKTNWNSSDFFTQPELFRYLSNVNAVRNAFYTLSATPPTLSDIRPWYNANAIEQILKDIYRVIELIGITRKHAPHAGDSYLGEDTTL